MFHEFLPQLKLFYYVGVLLTSFKAFQLKTFLLFSKETLREKNLAAFVLLNCIDDHIVHIQVDIYFFKGFLVKLV